MDGPNVCSTSVGFKVLYKVNGLEMQDAEALQIDLIYFIH